jgi:hypothetical protein
MSARSYTQCHSHNVAVAILVFLGGGLVFRLYFRSACRCICPVHPVWRVALSCSPQSKKVSTCTPPPNNTTDVAYCPCTECAALHAGTPTRMFRPVSSYCTTSKSVENRSVLILLRASCDLHSASPANMHKIWMEPDCLRLINHLRFKKKTQQFKLNN